MAPATMAATVVSALVASAALLPHAAAQINSGVYAKFGDIFSNTTTAPFVATPVVAQYSLPQTHQYQQSIARRPAAPTPPYSTGGYSWPISQRVQNLVANMSLEDKVGQFIEIDIHKYLYGVNCSLGSVWNTAGCEVGVSYMLNTTLLAQDFDTYRIGSLLNSPSSDVTRSPTATEWVNLINQAQQVALNHGSKIPFIHGLDTVHGANYVSGAALFPAGFTTAATFNTTHAYAAGATGGKDTRASGIPWVYAPILDIVSNQASSRTYETFGEDPYLSGTMGAAMISGYQGNISAGSLNSPTKVAACAKHFLAYQAERRGNDHGPSVVGTDLLYNIYVEPFQRAIDAGTRSIMSMYQSIDGDIVGASQAILQDLLRDTMQFDGMLVTDYNVVSDLMNLHHSARTLVEATYQAANKTSIDMFMFGTDPRAATYLAALVNQGFIPESRIDESVQRLLQIKEDVGLLDQPIQSTAYTGSVGQASDWELALEASREGIVLLTNNRLSNAQPSLPLYWSTSANVDTSNYSDYLSLSNTANPSASRTVSNIALVGPSGDSVALQTGGWSVHWQGVNPASADAEYILEEPNGYYRQTLYQALQNIGGRANISVSYNQGVDIWGNTTTSYNDAISAASSADAVVIAIGEHPYAENPGILSDTTLPFGQLQLVRNVRKVVQDKPIICVLYQGRLRNLDNITDPTVGCTALIHAGLPGPTGGLATAEILFGLVNPSGRLSVTYTQGPSDNGLTEWVAQNDQFDSTPLFPFGYGLTYSNFTYNVSAYAGNMTFGSSISIPVQVCNNSPRSGRDAVLLYVSQAYRAYNSPPQRLLKAFEKVYLNAFACTNLDFSISSAQLAYFNVEGWNWQTDAGLYNVTLGSPNATVAIPDIYCSSQDTYYSNYLYGATYAQTTGCGTHTIPLGQRTYFNVL